MRGHRSLLLKWHFQRNILFICKTERLIFTFLSSQGAVSKETTHVWNLGNAMMWALYHYCVHVRTFWKGRWTSKLLTATWQFRYEVWNIARCLQKPKIPLSDTKIFHIIAIKDSLCFCLHEILGKIWIKKYWWSWSPTRSWRPYSGSEQDSSLYQPS